MSYAVGFRCNAPSNNINSRRFIQCSEAHTVLLCKSCEFCELWEDYRIVGQVKVTIFILMYNLQPDNALHSHLQPISLVQISMKCCCQIFSINLLKVLSRIIWSRGSMTISKPIIRISRQGKYWMKLTFSKHILSRF